MKYFYGEYDGEEFPTQENLFGFDQLMEFIMEYGDQAMKALEQMMKDPEKRRSNLIFWSRCSRTACSTKTAKAS